MTKKEIITKVTTRPKISNKIKISIKNTKKSINKTAISITKKNPIKTKASVTKENINTIKAQPKINSKVEISSNKKSNKTQVVNIKTKSTKIYATGKRKTAIAKVWMTRKGSGKINIAGKKFTEYFQRPAHRITINQPFIILKAEAIYDIECQVLGSGLSGQAGAIRHGVSKALSRISEEYRKTLRNSGFLTRDSRKVERKKYGQPKARKKFQFSKR